MIRDDLRDDRLAATTLIPTKHNHINKKATPLNYQWITARPTDAIEKFQFPYPLTPIARNSIKMIISYGSR